MKPIVCGGVSVHPATLCHACGSPGVRVGTAYSPKKRNPIAVFRCDTCSFEYRDQHIKGRFRHRWRVPESLLSTKYQSPSN